MKASVSQLAFLLVLLWQRCRGAARSCWLSLYTCGRLLPHRRMRGNVSRHGLRRSFQSSRQGSPASAWSIRHRRWWHVVASMTRNRKRASRKCWTCISRIRSKDGLARYSNYRLRYGRTLKKSTESLNSTHSDTTMPFQSWRLTVVSLSGEYDKDNVKIQRSTIPMFSYSTSCTWWLGCWAAISLKPDTTSSL